MVKFSHLKEDFDTIDLEDGSRQVLPGRLHYPPPAYSKGPPKVAEGKFNDLMSLYDGQTPVISHQDHIAFYRNLPH